jgi:hypothetical protein
MVKHFQYSTGIMSPGYAGAKFSWVPLTVAASVRGLYWSSVVVRIPPTELVVEIHPPDLGRRAGMRE